jgi:hypothetical protein
MPQPLWLRLVNGDVEEAGVSSRALNQAAKNDSIK